MGKHTVMYHSALCNKNSEVHKINYVPQTLITGEGMAFVHSINDGMHKLFWGANSVYSEIAWKDGYTKFMERAGQKDYVPYNDYLSNVASIIHELKVPTILISGKTGAKQLGALWSKEIAFIEVGCKAIMYGFYMPEIEFKTNKEGMLYLIEHYGNTLDFCCGYGNVAKSCKELGKNFIASDVNVECIDYIQVQYLDKGAYDGI